VHKVHYREGNAYFECEQDWCDWDGANGCCSGTAPGEIANVHIVLTNWHVCPPLVIGIVE